MIRHMRNLAIGLLAVLALANGPVAAQTPDQIDDGDCDDLLLGPGLDPHSGGGIGAMFGDQANGLACDTAQRNRLTLIYQPSVIAKIVGGRLLAISPCALIERRKEDQQTGRTEEEQDCVDVNGLSVIPVAGPEQRLWNAWVDGKVSFIKAGDDVSPTDGPAFNGSGGIDYKLSDKVVIGLLGSIEASDLETGGFVPSTTRTDGIGGGAYVGVTLTPNIVFSGMVTGAQVGTGLDFVGVSADIDSTRLQTSAGLTGYWYAGVTRFSPAVTLAYSKEWQDDFVDSLGFAGPSQIYESAVLTFSSQIGRTIAITDRITAEPFLGGAIDYTFLSVIDVDGFPELDLGASYDARLQAGLNLSLGEATSLSFTGELSGLLLPDSDVYSGEVNFSVQF